MALKQIFIFLLLLGLTVVVMGKSSNKQDSLLNKQIISIQKSYRESRELTKEIHQLNTNIELLISNKAAGNNQVDKLKEPISSIAKELSKVRENKKESKSSSCTDWIRAIAAMLGIPVAIFGIIRLFKKDEERERQISSLEKLATTQNKTLTKFENQILELQRHTIEFGKQSISMVEQNSLLAKSLKIEQDKHKYETQKQYEELEEYFKQVLISIKSPVEKQVEKFKAFATLLAEDKATDFQPELETAILIENIENIEISDLYKIFVINRIDDQDKVTSFQNLTRAIAYIKMIKEDVKDSLDRFLNKYGIYEKEWLENIQALQGLYDQFLGFSQANQINMQEDILLSGWRDFVVGWIELENNPDIENARDPFFVFENYIKPLKGLCQENMGDSKIRHILPLLINCESSISNMRHQKTFYSDYYKSIAENMEKSSQNLFESLDKLEQIEIIDKFKDE